MAPFCKLTKIRRLSAFSKVRVSICFLANLYIQSVNVLVALGILTFCLLTFDLLRERGLSLGFIAILERQ